MPRRVLSNGLTVRLTPVRDIPYLVMLMALPGGANQEPAERAGLACLTTNLLERGCGSLDRDQVAEAIDSRGARLYTRTGRDACTLELHLLTQDVEWGFGLLADLVRRPHFEKEEFRKELGEAIGAATARECEPREMVFDQLGKALLGDHAYGRSLGGTTSTLPGLEVERVIDFYGRCYGPAGSILSLAGDLEPERAWDLVEGHLGDWTTPLDLSPLQDPQFPGESVLVTQAKEIEQAKVALAVAGFRRDDPDYYPALVLNDLFGGAFRSRLIRQIRSQEGLAYSVSSGFSAGLCRGMVRVSLQTSNETANRAIARVLQEMNRLTEELVSGAELEESQRGLVLGYPLKVDTSPKLASQAVETDIYRLPEDRSSDFREGVQSVTREDIRRVAQRLFGDHPKAVSVVADLSKANLVGFQGWGDEPPSEPFPPAPPIASPRPAGQVRSSKRRARQIHKVDYDNGLTFLGIESHKSPVASIQVFYRAGSRNEPEGKSGLSHLLEHMMFRGSRSYPDGCFDQLLALHGGNNNAFTSEDFTAYYTNIAADAAWLPLELEADRMAALAFQDEDFYRERDVVIEERRLRTEDSPSGLMLEQMQATAFSAHPYRRPVIGWMSDIAALSAEDLRHYHRLFYQPSNAVVVVAGAIDSERTAELVGTLFGSLSNRGEIPLVTTVEPPQLGQKRFTVHKEAGYGSLLFGYHVPTITHRDRFALELLSSILAEGTSSRLYEGLVVERELALNVWTYYDPLVFDPSLFYLGVEFTPDTEALAVEEAAHSLLQQAREGFQPTELAKAKRQWLADFVMKQDDAEELATLAGSFATVDTWEHLETDREGVEAVTLEDLSRVVEAYFGARNETVGVLVPQA